ncbi:hypothetical protein WA026_020443, partial [Henosepilachna vigintioctopunctata]
MKRQEIYARQWATSSRSISKRTKREWGTREELPSFYNGSWNLRKGVTKIGHVYDDN